MINLMKKLLGRQKEQMNDEDEFEIILKQNAGKKLILEKINVCILLTFGMVNFA